MQTIATTGGLIDGTPMQDIVNISHGYSDAMSRMTQMNKERKDLLKYIIGDVHLIEKRLEKFAGIDELAAYINKDDTHMNEFFVNEDGTYMEIVTNDGKLSAEDPKKELYEIKYSMLVYMKQSALFKLDIEEDLKKFDKERKEIESSMGTTANDIVIQQLNLAMEQKREIDESKEDVPKKILKRNQHIMSGFDFNLEIKVIREHPTIIQNTLHDFNCEHRIHEYGKRYRSTINKSKSLATLISFISNTPGSSFEELYLPPDKYKKGYENLFLFSIIRHFSMEYWTEDTKIQHAMTVSLLQQLTNDELPKDIKDKFIDNISNYLSIFYNN